MRRLILPVAVALTLAGCGGQSAEQQVRSVVNQFTVDIGQRGFGAGCALTTGQMLALCNQLRASGPAPTAAECQGAGNSVVGQACQAYQSAIGKLGSFTGLTISKIVIQGSSATVVLGPSEVMTLQDQGGKWLISSA
jgi:hypothetical protein